MSAKNCADVRVIRVSPHGPEGNEHGLWLLELENPGFEQVKPGQFAMLRPVSWGFDPLWGRPLSICRALPDKLVFHFLVAGRGTRKLSSLNQGDLVTIWGPLGNSFDMEMATPTLLLAGGIGIAPFVEYVATHPNQGRLSMLFGHRPPLSCYPFGDLARIISAESFQDKGPEDIPVFAAMIRERMADVKDGLVLACGPTPFLRTVRQAALDLGVRCQISLENRMACGVGACLGCVATDKDGHNVQTCIRGPVFKAGSVHL